MKFLKHLICFICLIATMPCFTFTAMADDKVSFSGGKIIFPDNDSIPDGNIADIKFNLDKVPPDLKFMVGKVYRGQGKNPQYSTPGLKHYLFLYDWTEENMKFVIANSGSSQIKAVAYRMTCLSKPSEGMNCTNKAGRALYRFSVQDGKPVLDASTGANVIFEEVAVIPADILRQGGK